jgi:hypothetical protein
MPVSDDRYARYGKIHSALDALGWGDEEYYAALWGTFEVESKTELSIAQLDAFIQILRKRMVDRGLLEPTKVKWGWGANKYEALRGRPGAYAAPQQLRLVEATWRDVARDESDEALRAFLSNHVGVDHIIWLGSEDVETVLVALKKMAEQQGKPFPVDLREEGEKTPKEDPKEDTIGDVQRPSMPDRGPRKGSSKGAAERVNLAEMTQKERLLWYLRTHEEITPAEAECELGIGRLAARVYDLRQEGYAIETDERRVEARFGEATVAFYSLTDE